MEFFGQGIYSNNINATNKRQMICLKDTRVPTCARVCAWVRVRARVGTCVCACACVRGFVSRFFSRGCVRVGACACACARVGGVGCKAARILARGQARWICTIHHEHKGISYSPPPRTQRDRLFTFTTSLRVISPQVGLLAGCLFSGYISISLLLVNW